MRIAIATTFITLTAGATLPAQQSSTPPTWEITLGAGALVTPRYTGSEEHQVFPLPLTQITWHGRVFLGPAASGNGFGLGAYAVRTPRLGVAVEAGFLPNRPASRADALAGMEDRDFVATAGVSLSYTLGRLEAGLSASQGMNDGAGLLGTARLGFRQPLGSRLIATAGIGATIADARQMRWDFGVSRAESLRRQALIAAGDDRLEPGEGRAYRPSGGVRQVGASLSLMYAVSRHWTLLGFGGADRLSDEAAASPLVRRRAQFTGGVGLGYRF